MHGPVLSKEEINKIHLFLTLLKIHQVFSFDCFVINIRKKKLI